MLEQYDSIPQELDKTSGQIKSGLTYLQEPYYNKLQEVCEDQEDYKLKEMAVEVQHSIEGR